MHAGLEKKNLVTISWLYGLLYLHNKKKKLVSQVNLCVLYISWLGHTPFCFFWNIIKSIIIIIITHCGVIFVAQIVPAVFKKKKAFCLL